MSSLIVIELKLWFSLTIWKYVFNYLRYVLLESTCVVNYNMMKYNNKFRIKGKTNLQNKILYIKDIRKSIIQIKVI